MRSPAEIFLNFHEHTISSDGSHGKFLCQAHDDRNMSGSWRECDDGRLLIRCHAGCESSEILSAVGLTLSDLFPDGPRSGRAKPQKRPFVASDVLRDIGADALLVSAAAVSVAAGEPVTANDREALIAAASRIQRAMSACGLEARRAQ